MRPRFRHLPHVTRLAGFVLVASLAGSLVAVRHARAQVHEGMRHLARQLMPYAEQSVIEAPRRVVINGESLYLAMGTTHDSIDAVLDFYETQCARRSGHVTASAQAESARSGTLGGATFNQLWAQAAHPGANLESWRESDGEQGYVACVDTGGRSLDTAELSRRVRAVVETGDLSRWGDLRYAYVTRGAGGTRILTVATEGRFNLLGMFPAQGDAPGDDTPGLARYPAMRRVLSAREDGHPNAMGMYTVQAPAGEVRAWYVAEMSRRGWTPMELPREGVAPEIEARRDRTAYFARGNDATLMLVFDNDAGTTSMMSLLAM